MSLSLPQYNGKDNKVMLAIVPLGACLINAVCLREQYISSLGYFVVSTLISTLSFGVFFILCGGIAVLFKNRFPHEEQAMKRLMLMIPVFIVMSGLFLYGLFRFYESVPFFQYRFEERRFAWTYFILGIVNVFLSLLMEGIAQYDEWESNWQETNKLNDAYKKSRLEGLKSQVNPHFLFNSLNSLSSLIQEDEEKAERFLDEMSKVYRYMLRDDAQWASLAEELRFVASYMFLLRTRFGEALQLNVDIPPSMEERRIAPLTLQAVIENAFMQNIARKDQPLHIEIGVNAQGDLSIRNNVQPKTLNNASEVDAGLDHLADKYKLLKRPIVVDESDPQFRIVTVPLFSAPQTETA